MRRPLARAVAALLLAAALTGCSDSQDDAVPGPGEPRIEVDTPELRAAKAEAGIEDCAVLTQDPGATGATVATGPSALPAVTLPCLGGGPSVDLADVRGPMVVNFWYAACRPCRKEMPILGDFHRQYGDQVPVLGVDMQDTVPGLALELAGERRATYPQLADPGGELLQQEAFVRANQGLPYLAVVDAEGVVQTQTLGGVDSMGELVTLVDDALGTDLAGSPGSTGSTGGAG